MRDLRPPKSISILTLALFLWILVLPALPALAAAAQPETVQIFDADGLRQLSKDCSYDKWSKGRTVLLEADIDLDNQDFVPIPIFGGTFDGKGHCIRGLSIKVEGSNQGLFRYLQEDAVIKNLIVEGAVVPGGDKSSVGGIAGVNGGTVENCRFSGLVRGKDNVGGIAGVNGSKGIVINCVSSGVVYGKSVIGGIAGTNSGTIVRCQNDSSVNISVEEQSLNLQELTVEDINLFRSFVDAMDIGGVAGINAGVLQTCENRGTVGYPHVGYNVGGVAGRQSGYITGCANFGHVYGRKEVGGIVGQMEPYITTSVDSSEIKVLRKELNRLQTLITEFIGDTQSSSNAINLSLSSVQSELDETKTHAESLISQTEILLNKDISEINRISLVATEAMDKMVPVMKAVADITETMDRSIGYMRQSVHYLVQAVDRFSQMGESVEAIVDAVQSAVTKALEAQAAFERATADLTEALELLLNGGTGTGGAVTSEVLALLNSALVNLQEAGEIVKSSFDELKDVPDRMTEIIAVLELVGDDAEHALTNLQDAMQVLEGAAKSLPVITRGLSDLVQYLSKQPGLDFQTTDDAFRTTKDNLFRSMGGLSDSVFRLINTVKAEGDVLLADIQKLSDQLFLVIDLAMGFVDGVSSGTIDTSAIVEDVSRNDVDGKAEGKVTGSRNLGVVEGDINVGGIAGAMSIELLKDLEEEFSLNDRPAIRTAFKTRAVISKCENLGEIIARKNNAGGIVGNMDLGYVGNCVSSGSVESTDGHYVGGIAGRSHSAINSSYAKSALSGGNYVGGIAGLGQEITGCGSLVTIERGKACQGAIAGDVDKDSIVKNNVFVSDVLAGVDGISYMGKAEPVSYEQFLKVKGVPDIFKGFQLSFWADGNPVGTLMFDYGDSVVAENIPLVPPKAGHYGRWGGLRTENLTSDLKIHAEYYPYEKLVGSDELRDGSISIVLVEGQFTDADCLVLSEVPHDVQSPAVEDEFVEVWRVSIPDDGAATHKVRFVPPEKKKGLAIRIQTGEGWTVTDVKWDGKYMVFEIGGNSVTFALVETGETAAIKWAVLGLAAAVISGLVLAFMRSLLKKRGTRRQVPLP